MSLCISVCVHTLTCVHTCYCIHVNVYVRCCADWRLFLCDVAYVRCPSPLIVDFVYMYATCVQVMCECFSFPPPGCAAVPPWVCIVKYDCECCSTVHVCLLYTLSYVYFDYLCYLDTVTCSVVLIVCMTCIVRYSSTRDLLGLEERPGLRHLPWLFFTRSRSLVVS